MLRSTVVVLSLLYFGTHAASAATWVKLFDDPERTRYVDADSIRSEGSLVKIWQLTDYRKNPDGDPYLSTKHLAEFDCKGMRVRNLHLVAYSGNMGRGSVHINHSLAADWGPLVPGSTDEAIARHVVCKLR